MRPTLLIWWISTDALLLIDISLKGGRDGGWWYSGGWVCGGRENVPSAEM